MLTNGLKTVLKNIPVSLLVNTALALGILVGFFTDPATGTVLKTLGLYGLSGSITNSLAITMIFHRIPGLFGSGIIEKNFDSFKSKLKETLISHLFNDGLEIHSWNISLFADELYTRLKESNLSLITQFISREHLVQLLNDLDLSAIFKQAVGRDQLDVFLTRQIDKLSPDQVKALIMHIIEEHLQWLVLWGAIFGVIFGIASFALTV